MKLDGMAAQLYEEICKIPVVDCHEHLPTEAARLATRTDVTTLFTHYCKPDLAGVGLPMGKEQDEVLTPPSR